MAVCLRGVLSLGTPRPPRPWWEGMRLLPSGLLVLGRSGDHGSSSWGALVVVVGGSLGVEDPILVVGMVGWFVAVRGGGLIFFGGRLALGLRVLHGRLLFLAAGGGLGPPDLCLSSRLPGRLLFLLFSCDLGVPAGWPSLSCPSRGAPACAFGLLPSLAGPGSSVLSLAPVFASFLLSGEQPFSLRDLLVILRGSSGGGTHRSWAGLGRAPLLILLFLLHLYYVYGLH